MEASPTIRPKEFGCVAGIDVKTLPDSNGADHQYLNMLDVLAFRIVLKNPPQLSMDVSSTTLQTDTRYEHFEIIRIQIL